MLIPVSLYLKEPFKNNIKIESFIALLRAGTKQYKSN
jgi:hypothetical protein